MSSRISSVQAERALRVASGQTRNVKKTERQLASGSRINAAGDDAVGLAVSEKLRSHVEGLRQAARNIQDGIALCQFVDGTLQKTNDMLQRLRTLATQAANDTLTTADRRLIQFEFNQLIGEIDRISSVTRYNNRKLCGPVPNQADPADIVFVVDSSATMGPFINNVINGLNSLTDGLAAAGISARYALLDVNNTRYPIGPDNGVNLDQDFTNKAGIANALAALLPVTAGLVRNWDAIQAALPGGADMPSWRDPSTTLRFMIQVTDTTANEGGTVTSEAAQAANLVANNTVYFGIIDLGAPGEVAQYDDLANATGGQLFNVASANYNPLLSAIRNQIIATAVGFELEGPWVIHVGPDSGQSLSLSTPLDLRPSALGVDGLDVTTRTGAENALDSLTTAIDMISGYRAQIGAEENRLRQAYDFNKIEEENAAAARSKMKDADFGDSISSLARARIMEQVSLSALAQANAAIGHALTLLGR